MGEEDHTRYTWEKISEDDLEGRVAALLKNVDWRPNLSGAFRASRRPREVLLRVVDCSLSRVLLSSSRVYLVSFMQISPENYQSRPPLPEDVPLMHTNSSVNLTSFSFALFLVRVVGSSTDDGCFWYAGPSASQTASNVQDRAADEPTVESTRTQKRRAASAGSSDR